MKNVFLTAVITTTVGLFSAFAQEPAPYTPTDNTQERILQDTVIDNSNIPEEAGPVEERVLENDNGLETDSLNDTTETLKEGKPADKIRNRSKKKN